MRLCRRGVASACAACHQLPVAAVKGLMSRAYECVGGWIGIRDGAACLPARYSLERGQRLSLLIQALLLPPEGVCIGSSVPPFRRTELEGCVGGVW